MPRPGLTTERNELFGSAAASGPSTVFSAASASMPADRVIRSLRTHFDITEIDRDGVTRYELRDWVPQHKATGVALRDEWVPSELIGIVASAKEYQTDYEKRTRELRL